jgi:hypothetical protein
MNTKRIAAAALISAAVVGSSVAPASAQSCYSQNLFPLVFPFGVAAAIVETAVTVATLPLALLTAPAYVPVYPRYGACASPYYGYPPPPPYNPAAANQYAPPPGYYGYYGPR